MNTFRKLLAMAATAALLTGLLSMSALAAETKAKDAPQTAQMGNPNCPGFTQGHMQGRMMNGSGGCPMMGAMGQMGAGAATRS